MARVRCGPASAADMRKANEAHVYAFVALKGWKDTPTGEVDLDRAEKDIRRKEGIIHSMTPLERRKPDLIKATRKRRIAQGAGVQVQEVNRLLKEFEQMQDMMKKMKGGGLMKMMKRMGGMKGMGGFPGMR